MQWKYWKFGYFIPILYHLISNNTIADPVTNYDHECENLHEIAIKQQFSKFFPVIELIFDPKNPKSFVAINKIYGYIVHKICIVIKILTNTV